MPNSRDIDYLRTTNSSVPSADSRVITADHDLVPYLNRSISSQDFVNYLLKRSSDPQQKLLRRAARAQIMQMIECRTKPTDKIKMVVFDVDQTLALLYPIMSTSAVWALGKLADRNGLKAQELYQATKEISDVYLCHSEGEFLEQLSNLLGEKKISPQNPENRPILEEWHQMRVQLNQRWVFKDILPGIKRIKNEGGLVYIASNAPQASVLHRLFLWLGPNGDKLIDGVAFRDNLPGMSSKNERATEQEKAFVDKLEADEKTATVPESLMKPHNYHINLVYKHANERLVKMGCEQVKPPEVIMFGDSISSDGGAADNLARSAGDPAQFVLTLKGLMTDPVFKDIYNIVGDKKFMPDAESVLRKIQQGAYARPVRVVSHFHQLFEHYTIVPATCTCGRPPAVPVEAPPLLATP